MAGDGQTSKQMDAQHAFVYFLQNGWSVGTNPDVFVDWKAKPGNQVTFPVGLQVEKLRKVGSLPVKFDVRAEYYAVRPEVYGPKWGRTYGSHLSCRHSSDGQFSEFSLSRLNALGPAWRRHNVLELRIDERTNTTIT